ncbi:type II secretion system F family protein [Microlunatus ginsengisoli]|uniref:Type II secretion system protein GspF domain-containing protein n=1 Tax=Microlunatus ginsengisoli TaxID=363863 RepID=A0ABP7AQ73_9ACTN
MSGWTAAALSAVFAAVAVLCWLAPARDRRLRRGRAGHRTSRAGRDAPAAATAGEHPDGVEPPVLPPWQRAGRAPGWRGVLAGRFDAPSRGRRVLVAAALALVAAVVATSLLPTVPLALLVIVAPVATAAGAICLGLLEPAATRRRNRRLVMDAPQALDLLAACLAAGLPARNATAAVVAVFDGPVADDLGYVVRAVDVGLSDVDAWRALRGHPQLGEAAVDLARAVESGTRMVETLTFYADEARLRRAAAVESAAKAVSVRCVLPMTLCFIPAFILLGVLPATISAFLAAVPDIF